MGSPNKSVATRTEALVAVAARKARRVQRRCAFLDVIQGPFLSRPKRLIPLSLPCCEEGGTGVRGQGGPLWKGHTLWDVSLVTNLGVAQMLFHLGAREFGLVAGKKG